MNNDQEHLRLLSIFHYVLGGLVGLFACMPLIHVTIGILMIVSGDSFSDGAGSRPPAFAGWMFVVMGGLFVLAGWTLAVFLLIAGGCLRRRTHYTFCFVVACLACAFTPMGTVLGVFTIIVLSRASVKALFNRAVPPAETYPPQASPLR